MNPAPDAERSSIQDENFEWILATSATYLIEEAKKGRSVPKELVWSQFLNGEPKKDDKKSKR